MDKLKEKNQDIIKNSLGGIYLQIYNLFSADKM